MLEVRNLITEYWKDEAAVRAVDNVSFLLGRGEIVGIVGESGSGKSTIALSILRLIAAPGKIISGEILLAGRDLLKLPENELINIRGANISMIFQDPFSSLNPVFTIGDQIAEAVQLHQGLSRKGAWQRAVEMLEMVQIKEPKSRAHDYPHQFSGGMRQRAMIAMALACQPELLIADEPTTALDVTIQAEILDLLRSLKKRFNLSILYITHNFGIVNHLCNRVLVMNQGKVVEAGATEQIFNNPQNIYTQKLINSLKELNNANPNR